MAGSPDNLLHWPTLIAGISGGVAATIALHPLDLAKIRLQVNEGTGFVAHRPISTGTITTLVEVVKYRGFRGLYLGLTPNLIGAGSSWGLYFFFYSIIKRYVQTEDETKPLSTISYLGCAALSGIVTLTIVNPIWVVKTRLCLQYERLAQISSLKTSETTFNALHHIWRNEGFYGLYRGYLPGIFGVSHGAIQFMLYERLRNTYNQGYRNRPVNAKLTAGEYLTFASLSKLIAVSLTYPYQVVRSRLQDQHRNYSGALHVCRELWRKEGLFGFYKGLVPNLVKCVPACGITFLVYECTLDFLQKVVS